MTPCEKRGNAAVAWLKGTKHKYYEDRYRLLSYEIPLVRRQGRGELFAVFDGIGSAPQGRQSAQLMSDQLVDFWKIPEKVPGSWEGLVSLLMGANQVIADWGFMEGTLRPLGGCAGTVVWLHNAVAYVFHAGDTQALLIRDGKVSNMNRLHEAPNGAIFRYFGLGSSLQIDVDHFALEESDRILMVSDGVTKAFHPAEAGAIVEQFDEKCRAVTELVNRSRSRGSADDITALLIEVEEL